MAFISLPPPTLRLPPRSSLSPRFPRRVFLLLPLIPLPALALSQTAAYAQAKAALASIETLSELVALEEWERFRLELRTGAMGRVRAACSQLVKTAARMEEAKNSYRRVINQVERVDGEALRKERGGDVGVDLTLLRGELEEFLKLVEE